MSSDDDTKVVNLQINNKQFLKGTGDSLKALDTLNKGIDSAGKGKGMQDMSKSVDTVKTKFGALQVAGVTALGTITNKAVNAGLRLVKSLTIGPVIDGFREYEKLLKSTQTIRANTGAPLRNVENSLRELNKYSDQTIYNFGQMADSIGKFTAAGGKGSLESSVATIKGMSNAAALAGSDVNQLNTAMYQMSQAVSSGTIKLMDWNSLVNAGMGGKNMQYALKEAARSMDGYRSKMEAATAGGVSFRDSLQAGWLGADVFSKAMKTMSGQVLSANSSAKQLADLGLSKAHLETLKLGGTVKFTAKEIANLKERGFDKASISALEAGKSVAYTAEQLEKMGYSKEAAKELSRLGAAALESAVKVKSFTQLLGVVRESVGSGFAEVFRLVLGDLEESGKLWTKVSNTITGAIDRIFGAIVNMLIAWRTMEDSATGLNGYQMAWAAIGNVFKSIGNILKPFLSLFLAILPGTGTAGAGLFTFTQLLYKLSVALEKATSGFDAVNPMFNLVGTLVGYVVQSFVELFQVLAPLGPALFDLAKSIQGLFVGFFEMIELEARVDAFFQKFIEVRTAILEPIVKTLSEVAAAFETLFSGDASGFRDQLKDAFTNLAPLKDLYKSGKESAKHMIDGLKEGFSDGSIRAAISGFVNDFVNFFKDLLGIHSPSTVFAEIGGNIVQGLVKGIQGAIGLIGDALSWIGDQLGSLDRYDIANVISLIFSAVAIRAIMKFMNSIGQAFTTFAGFAEDFRLSLTDAMDGITAAANKQANAKVIQSLGIAIGILAASLWVLSKIPYDRLLAGVATIGLMMRMLQVVISDLTEVDEESPITKESIAQMLAMATAMGIMAAAVLLLSAAVLAFGMMPTGVLVKGLIAVGVAMAMLSAMSIVLGKASPWLIAAGAAMMFISTGLLILSVAMTSMSAALLLYSQMDWSTILDGLLKMGVVLVGLGAAIAPLALLAPGVLIAAAALVVLGIGLTAMLGVLLAFAAADTGSIWKGIGLLSAALIAVGVAALVAAPGLALLGVAFLAIGAGLLAAGLGMSLLGAGLAVLVASGMAGFAVLISGIELFLAALPLMGVQFILALTTILQALAAKAPEIVDSLVKIGGELLRGLTELAPKVAEAVLSILQSFLDAIIDHQDALTTAVTDLMVAFINGITDRVEDLIAAGTDLVVAILKGIGESSEEIIPAAGQMILDFLNAVDQAVQRYMPQIVKIGRSIAFHILQGLIDGLIPEDVQEAFRNLVDKVVEFFKGLLGIKSPSTVFKGFGGDIVRGLGEGITSAIGVATGAVGQLVGRVLSTVGKLPSRVGGALSGLAGAFGKAFDAARKAVSGAVNRIGQAIAQLPGKISGVIGRVSDAARNVGSSIVKSIGRGLGNAGGFVRDMANDLKAAINSGLGLPRSVGFSKKILGKTVSARITLPAFAKGVTGFGGGSALVGEKGPEIVTMGRGSNVITNENLVKFMKTVSNLTRSLTRGSGNQGQNSSGGSIVYAVSADFSGNPKASGTAFAANIAAGLINGLTSNQPAINKAMTGAAEEMSQSFADTLEIRSPSRVFHQYAGYVGKGFINGLLQSVEGVKKAAEVMAKSAIDTVSKTISDGQLKLEAQSGKADAYSAAAALVRKKASKTKDKKEKKRLEKEAKALSKRAKAAQKEADAQQKKVDSENKAKERAAAYEKADIQGKADMKNEDALASANYASSTREAAIKLSKQADLVRKYDKKKAKALDLEAKKQLERSKIFADRSLAQAKLAADLTAQAKAEADKLNVAEQEAQIQSVSTDQVAAAQAQFDAYTKQLQEAMEAAGTKEPSVTNNNFTQNNTSPEAIPPSEAYRNGKSLLSTMERKLTPATD